jgi:hypothetical protein
LILALKLLLVPLFLAAITLAGRRWGPAVAGWLAGLPLVTGPILFFLAIEQGDAFAAGAAAASLSAVFSALCFIVTYAWAARRRAWPGALLAGLGCWSLATLLLGQLPASVGPALGVALAALIAAPKLFPMPGGPPDLKPLPRGNLPARMVAGVVLTLVVTFTAERIGPTWSGLLTVFPVLGLVMAVFSHASNGASFVVILLRAMARGMWSFAVFCLCLALTLAGQGIVVSFCLSIALTAGAQWVVAGRLPRNA